jgi:hypothetical protein
VKKIITLAHQAELRVSAFLLKNVVIGDRSEDVENQWQTAPIFIAFFVNAAYEYNRFGYSWSPSVLVSSISTRAKAILIPVGMLIVAYGAVLIIEHGGLL